MGSHTAPELDPLSRKRKKQRRPAADEAMDVESSESQFCKTKEGSVVTGNHAKLPLRKPSFQEGGLIALARRRITASSAKTQ